MKEKKIFYLLLGLTIAAALLIYWQTLGYGFLRWDTHLQITQNDDIRNFNWNAIKTFFSKFYLGMYQPLATLSYALEYKLAGLNSFVYHLDNVMLHLANILLVYIFVFKICSRRFIGWLAASLFALHPLMVETVAWLSTRSNLLYTFFYLLGLILYLRYLKTKRLAWLVAVGGAFLLSLSAKVAAISLPLALLAVDWLKGRQIKLRQIIDKAILLILSIPFAVAALNARHPYEHYNSFPDTLTWIDNIFLNFYALIFYPLKLLIPSALSPLYAYPESLNWYHYAAPFLVLALIFLAIKFLKGKRLLAFGLIFYTLTILPMLKIIPMGTQHTADRYAYLPAIGFFIFIAALLDRIIRQHLQTKFFKLFLIIMIAAWLMTVSFLSYLQAWYWQDNLVLSEAMLKNNPQNAVVLKFKGNDLADHKKYEEAIYYYDQALIFEPNYAEAINAKAAAIMSAGQDYAKALPLLIKAAQLEPKNPIIHFNLGIALMHQKNYKGALTEFNLTYELKNSELYPMSQIEWSQAALNRGYVLMELGMADEALRDFQKITINSTSKLWQAKAYLQLDRNETACDLLKDLEHQEAITLYDENCQKNQK